MEGTIKESRVQPYKICLAQGLGLDRDGSQAGESLPRHGLPGAPTCKNDATSQTDVEVLTRPAFEQIMKEIEHHCQATLLDMKQKLFAQATLILELRERVSQLSAHFGDAADGLASSSTMPEDRSASLVTSDSVGSARVARHEDGLTGSNPPGYVRRAEHGAHGDGIDRVPRGLDGVATSEQLRERHNIHRLALKQRRREERSRGSMAGRVTAEDVEDVHACFS